MRECAKWLAVDVPSWRPASATPFALGAADISGLNLQLAGPALTKVVGETEQQATMCNRVSRSSWQQQQKTSRSAARTRGVPRRCKPFTAARGAKGRAPGRVLGCTSPRGDGNGRTEARPGRRARTFYKGSYVTWCQRSNTRRRRKAEALA
jgi:hypothetical protein